MDEYIGPLHYSSLTCLPATTTLGLLAATLELELDPEKGILLVQLFAHDPAVSASSEDLAGATIDIDVAYDTVLVSDASGTAGIASGNVTVEGSQSFVIFVNVPAGPVVISTEEPDGHACTMGTTSIEMTAGAYISANQYCPPS